MQEPIFDFVGNHLCLDFTNTVNGRLTAHPVDLFASYEGLVAWSRQAHIVPDEEAQALLAEAATHPDDAEAAVQHAQTLRTAIYHIFSALAQGANVETADLLALNAALSRSLSRACIVQQDARFTWDWTNKEDALERMLWAVTRSAADLLTSEELHTVRQCADTTCTWLFADTSKNHSRRWCDMKNCGNKAKAGRHYVRKKQSA